MPQLFDITDEDSPLVHGLKVFANQAGEGLSTAMPYVLDTLNAVRFSPLHGEVDKKALLGQGKYTQKAREDYQRVVGTVEPRNRAEEYIAAVGQGVGGSLLPVGEFAGLGHALVAGVVGGAAAQGAHELFPNSEWAPLVAGLTGGLAGGVGSHAVTTKLRTPSATTIAKGLMDRGFAPHEAQGIAAGVFAESRANPNAVNPTSGAHGIGQWLGPRKAELIRRYGPNPTLDQQLDFLTYELRGGDHGGKAVLSQKDARSVMRSYITDFMRPAKGKETIGDLNRGSQALGENPVTSGTEQVTGPKGLGDSLLPEHLGPVSLVQSELPSVEEMALANQHLRPPEVLPENVNNEINTARNSDLDNSLIQIENPDEFHQAVLQASEANPNWSPNDEVWNRLNQIDLHRAEIDRSMSRFPDATTPADRMKDIPPTPEPIRGEPGEPTGAPKRSGLDIIKDLLKDESGELRGDAEGPSNESLLGKLREAIRNTSSVAKEQAQLIHNARGVQSGILKTLQKQGASYEEQIKALAGKLPGADYESIRDQFSPEEIHQLEQMVNGSNRLREFEKVNVLHSLHKLLSDEGVKVPTELELRNMTDVFGKDLTEEIMNKRKATAGDILENVANIPKTLQASVDVSGASRQAFPFISRPEFWKNLPPMFKVYFDRVIHGKDAKALTEYMNGIRDMDTYGAMKDAGVDFTGADFAKGGEDYFQGNYAEKIPVYGTRLVKGSDEAFSGYLNLLRAQMFDKLYKAKIAQGGIWNRAQLRELGEYVNTGTGRGGLFDFLKSSKKLLNTLFWSAGLQASRMKLISPHYAARLYRTDPFLFKQYTRDMTGMIIAGATMIQAARMMMPDATVETDPRSTDFLKIKVGQKRYDVLGSFQPYLRLIAQQITGEKKNVNTGKIKNLGPNLIEMAMGKNQSKHYPGFGEETRGTVAFNFFGNKLAPLPSLLVRAMTQTNSKKLDWGEEAAKLGVPMWFPDVVNNINKELHGKESDAGSEFLLSFLGFGVQEYDKPKPKKKGGHKDSFKVGKL